MARLLSSGECRRQVIIKARFLKDRWPFSLGKGVKDAAWVCLDLP